MFEQAIRADAFPARRFFPLKQSVVNGSALHGKNSLGKARICIQRLQTHLLA